MKVLVEWNKTVMDQTKKFCSVLFFSLCGHLQCAAGISSWNFQQGFMTKWQA